MRLHRIVPLLLFLAISISGPSQTFEVADSLFKLHINSDAQQANEALALQEGLIENQDQRAEYLMNKGLFFTKTGQFDSALQANGTALQIASSDLQVARALRYRGVVFRIIDQADSSLNCFRGSLSRMPAENNREHVLLHKNIAEVYLRRNQPDSTRRHLDLGESLAVSDPENSLQANLASIMRMRGQMLRYLSRYDSAMLSYGEALRIYESLGQKRTAAATLIEIADLFSLQNRHREAIRHYRRAMKALVEIQDRATIASSANNLGLIYLRLSETDSAAMCFRQALSIATATQMRRLEGNAHGNLANIHLEEGRNDSAAFHAATAYQIFSDMGDSYGLSLSLMVLGEMNSREGQQAKGLKQLRQANELALQLDVPELLKDATLALSNAHKRAGRPDSALVYYEQHVTFKDSIASAAVRKEIERLRIKYETQLQEEENKRLVEELGWEVEKRNRERLVAVLVGVSASLVLLALIAFLYFRSQLRKRQLLVSRSEAEREKAEKAHAQERLAGALRQITEKDQLLDRLEEYYQESVSPAAFASKLQERINTSQDWMQFVIEFEMVYKGFFDGLSPKENKLTKNDLRMAALVKLQLSNKEIAELLHITAEGVKKAKHRLKKKLQLPAETDLNTFLANASN